MAATFLIDNTAMDIQPSHIAVIPPTLQVYPTTGANKIVVQSLTPPTIEVRWGMDATYPEVISELKRRRGRRMVHVISWTDEEGMRLKHCNAVFPEIGSGQGPTRTAVDVLTLTLEAVNPIPGLVVIHLIDRRAAITVADGVDRWEALAGGRILKANGTILNLGTISDGTKVQIRNSTTDYLSTRGDFLVASGTRRMENQVLAPNSFFERKDVLEMDIDGIPGGSDSLFAIASLHCLLFEV